MIDDLNLADDAYFKRFCDGVDIVFRHNLGEVTYVKDCDSVFRYINKAYLYLVYPDKPWVEAEDILGTTRGRIKTDKRIDDIFEDLLEEDEKVCNSESTNYFLRVDGSDRLFIVSKRAVINPATGNTVGLFCQMRNYFHPHMLNLIYKINGVEFGVGDSSEDQPLKYKLTQRQHMVLFLYLFKYSHTQISSIMTNLGHKISAGRVNEHLGNLKHIFGVEAKDQLIERALNCKYNQVIPREFLKVGSYSLNENLIVSRV
jgi:DNA-binding CsgD family transcriptional regulator